MTPSIGLSRRGVLGAGLAATAGLGGWPGHVRSAQAATAGWSPSRLLAAVVPDLARARGVGRAWLRTCPAAGASAAELTRLIFSAPPAAFADDADVRRFVAGRLRQDFLDGAVVGVDGWMLALTEARLCALAVVA